MLGRRQRKRRTKPLDQEANANMSKRYVKDLPGKVNIQDYKLKISGVEQLTDEPLKEGWYVSPHAKPGGWFMSPDPPESKTRRLIPTYGDPKLILEWEIVEEYDRVTHKTLPT